MVAGRWRASSGRGRGRGLRIAAAVVVGATVGAACGDDDGGSGLTKEEFIEAADAI